MCFYLFHAITLNSHDSILNVQKFVILVCPYEMLIFNRIRFPITIISARMCSRYVFQSVQLITIKHTC